MGVRHASIDASFFSKVEKTDGCWKWAAAKHRQGYGNIWWKGKCLLAHRVSWLIHHGSLADDIKVLHECDNTECTNPSHLFLGTQKDNVADAIKKDRFYFVPVKHNVERNRFIRHLYFAEIKTQQEIADFIGLDQTQISQIVRRNLA